MNFNGERVAETKTAKRSKVPVNFATTEREANRDVEDAKDVGQNGH